MFQVSRTILTTQSLSRLCARSMGKMDQFKWKAHKKRPNKKPKLSVILRDHIEGLGHRGQLVHVERGFARNFLVPKEKAAYTTKDNIRKYLTTGEDAAKNDPEAQVSTRFMKFLKRTKLTVERKENVAFEISEHQLALEYQRQLQLYVPAHCIKLSEPIKSFGKHTVDLAVRESVLVPMNVYVQPWTPKIPLRFQKVMSPADEMKSDKST